MASGADGKAAAPALVGMLVDAGLAPHLADTLGAIRWRPLKVDTRRPFRHVGSPANELIFVVAGLLAQFKQDHAGRRQIIALRYPGEAILPREGDLDFGVCAIVTSELLIADARDLNVVLDSHPEIGLFLYRQLQRQSAIGHEWLVNTGRRDSTARVAHLLCETAYRTAHGKTERLVNPFTQQQMADITGQTAVNVNRVIGDLERQGLIERHGREMIFRDWTELRRIAEFDPSYLS